MWEISIPQAVITALLSGGVSIFATWMAQGAQSHRDEANNVRALRSARYQRCRDAYKGILHAAVTWQTVAMRKSNDLLPSSAPKETDPALRAYSGTDAAMRRSQWWKQRRAQARWRKAS